MDALVVVVHKPILVPGIELYRVFCSSWEPPEELFFVCSKAALDDGILVRAALVDVVVLPPQFFRDVVSKPRLKLQAIVSLDKVRRKRQEGDKVAQRFNSQRLVNRWQDDTLFIPTVDIHDCIQVGGMLQAGELWCDILDIHL